MTINRPRFLALTTAAIAASAVPTLASPRPKPGKCSGIGAMQMVNCKRAKIGTTYVGVIRAGEQYPTFYEVEDARALAT